MWLLKCKCGNFTTLDNNFFLERRAFHCQNCLAGTEISSWTEIGKMKEILEKDNFELYLLPEDTSLDFNFSIKK